MIDTRPDQGRTRPVRKSLSLEVPLYEGDIANSWRCHIFVNDRIGGYNGY
jgi:hypothetical protein